MWTQVIYLRLCRRPVKLGTRTQFPVASWRLLFWLWSNRLGFSGTQFVRLRAGVSRPALRAFWRLWGLDHQILTNRPRAARHVQHDRPAGCQSMLGFPKSNRGHAIGAPSRRSTQRYQDIKRPKYQACGFLRSGCPSVAIGGLPRLRNASSTASTRI